MFNSSRDTLSTCEFDMNNTAEFKKNIKSAIENEIILSFSCKQIRRVDQIVFLKMVDSR